MCTYKVQLDKDKCKLGIFSFNGTVKCRHLYILSVVLLVAVVQTLTYTYLLFFPSPPKKSRKKKSATLNYVHIFRLSSNLSVSFCIKDKKKKTVSTRRHLQSLMSFPYTFLSFKK